MLKTSDRGIALIRRFEGAEKDASGFHVAYRDVAGVWTIGYGHTAGFKDGRFTPDSVVAEEDAAALLREDLASREALLDEWMDEHGVDLNRNEFDALISFIFNVGFSAFEGSTAAERLRSGDRLGAAEALTWWNKATVDGQKIEVRGLTRRRASERALFLRSASSIRASAP